MIELAIIIPAYKQEYFEKALNSICSQTNKNFNLYVGDDCSPYSLKEICNQFADRINLNYHRFEKNLGGKDLVAQWERCVNLAGDEKWIWLFSDDDLADSNCVEKFYEALSITSSFYDVYRFNTSIIDADDIFLAAARVSPKLENPMSLAINILKWKRGNSMPDHIFKKQKYNELGGFVNFIQGQASDWATSINFSYPKGLYTIEGPRVEWRRSGKNISSNAAKNKSRLIFGHLEFIYWINNKFNNADQYIYGVKLSEIHIESKNNLAMVLKSHYKGIPWHKFIEIALIISKAFNEPLLKSFMFCFKINYVVFRSKY